MQFFNWFNKNNTRKNLGKVSLSMLAGAGLVNTAYAFDIPKGFEDYKEAKCISKTPVNLKVYLNGIIIILPSFIQFYDKNCDGIPEVSEYYIPFLSNDKPFSSWFDKDGDGKMNLEKEVYINEEFDISSDKERKRMGI